MAFFQKLKERLFKSSSKLEEGLDAILDEAPAPPEAAEPERAGLVGRLLGQEKGRVLDDDMLEGLEELLIQADMGVDTALKVSARVAEGRFGRRVGAREIREALAGEIAAILEPVARPMPLTRKRPQVVLVVGVNGSGKTTTIGKLASQFRAAGKRVVIAAGDTFRAAAVEQLQIWGERAGVPVMTAAQGSDPASLAFDALARAEARGGGPAADRHRRAAAEPRGPDGGAREDRAGAEQARPGGAAEHAAGARRDDRAERAQPGRDLPADRRGERAS